MEEERKQGKGKKNQDKEKMKTEGEKRRGVEKEVFIIQTRTHPSVCMALTMYDFLPGAELSTMP
jgi:hypothetical protein